MQSRWSLGVACVCLLSFLFSSAVSAQDLDAFRTAAAADGVNVIPFPDLRAEATSIADEVQRRKVDQRYDYSLLERQKNNLLEAVKETRELIRKKDAEIEEFKRAHPNGSGSAFEAERRTLQDKLEDQLEAIEDMNDDVIDDAIEAWQRLWNARAGLRETFDKVLRKLPDVKSSPGNYIGSNATSEDTDKLKRYVDVIEDEIEIGARTHKDEEDGAKGMIEKLTALLAKDSI
jgi:hypothetical protein